MNGTREGPGGRGRTIREKHNLPTKQRQIGNWEGAHVSIHSHHKTGVGGGGGDTQFMALGTFPWPFLFSVWKKHPKYVPNILCLGCQAVLPQAIRQIHLHCFPPLPSRPPPQPFYSFPLFSDYFFTIFLLVFPFFKVFALAPMCFRLFSSPFLFFLLIFFLHRSCAQRRSVPIPLEMDQRLTAGREAYDKQSTPTQNEGVPTSVKLAMYIEGIGSFRTHTMDFQLDVYLQQFWKDPRLAHNESSRILIRDRAILNRIWHPDVYFANARIAQFHEVTQPNFLLWIEPDGSILYDTRVSMIVICAMNLKNFPLDSQWCHLRILSYAYDIHHLLIEWVDTDPITKNMNITMSDMDIVKLIPGSCDGNYSTGVWSCVTAEFFVSRELTHHILQTYVPTTLIVVISWFSFWLDVEAVPARVSLAITTLLTLSTQANSVKNSLPEVSYMKSLDLFLAISVLFVFGVLIEFTIVNYTQRNATMAAAGLLADKAEEEEEDEGKGGKLGLYLRRARRWFRRKKEAKNKPKLREQRQQNHFVDKNNNDGGKTRGHSPAAQPNGRPFLGNGLFRRLIRNKETGESSSLVVAKECCDIERGITNSEQNHWRNGGIQQQNGTKSAKKILALESRNQLQYHGLNRCASGDTVTPTNVWGEEGEERGAGVGRREAARIAHWANAELSCEQLAQKAWGPPGNAALVPPPPYVIVEPDAGGDGGKEPPSSVHILPMTECSPSPSTLSASSGTLLAPSPDVAQGFSSLAPSSSSPADGSLAPAGRPKFRPPIMRRKSAMASLLDPINIGSGEKAEEGKTAENNEKEGEGKGPGPKGSQGQGTRTGGAGRQGGGGGGGAALMSTQAKWRHAVRKLQMNKREAGRIQAKKIDAVSRWAFPLTYLSFQAAYWYYYLRVAA